MRHHGLAVVSRPALTATIHSSIPRRCISQHAPASIAKLLDWRPEDPAKDVVVNGFVRSVRSMKSHQFLSLGDGSSLASLQAVLPPATQQDDGLAVGAAVRLRGSWVPSRGSGQSHELHVEGVEVLGPSDAKTFPIQKKYQTPEYLRTIPHLRPRTPYNSALLRLRSNAIASMTQFFANRSFVQTHPPIITSSDCEGAGEVFTVSPADKTSVQDNEAGTRDGFFRSPKYLTVSSQLHLEALAQSVGNVWALSPTFRAEKSDTSRHLSEFYMLEAEMSFVDDVGSIMDLAEDMLRYLGTSLFDSPVVREILSRSNQTGSDLAPADEVRQRWEGLLQTSWPRMTYSEAIKILSAKSELFDHKPEWGEGLQAEHEKYLARHVAGGHKPIFITNYPRDIKAFYMRQSPSEAISHRPQGNADGNEALGATVECFDLLVPELCEIAGGSMREHRLQNLIDAMRLHHLTLASDAGDGRSTAPESDGLEAVQSGTLDWYVDLRRWGCPPHGGFGVGFDRLLCYLSGVQTIRDVVAFPRWYGRCDC